MRASRVGLAALVVGVVAGTAALGYAMAGAATPGHRSHAVAAAPRAVSTPTPTPTPTTRPTPVATPTPAGPRPGRRLLGPGNDGAQVRELQARLRQIGWYAGHVTDQYGPATTTAVRGFQAKREIPVSGYVDPRTSRRLLAMTHAPTADELANRFPGDTHTQAPLDARCLTGRAICVDKRSSTLRWVVDGQVQRTLAVRFGAAYTPTREGLFHVEWKSRDHVSKEYGSSMPFAMFFSRGQAVHYSSDFAARGYAGASHGCVNVRDYDGVRWLFDQANVGDKVVVYWSGAHS